jgi:hypothetical protein
MKWDFPKHERQLGNIPIATVARSTHGLLGTSGRSTTGINVSVRRQLLAHSGRFVHPILTTAYRWKANLDKPSYGTTVRSPLYHLGSAIDFHRPTIERSHGYSTWRCRCPQQDDDGRSTTRCTQLLKYDGMVEIATIDGRRMRTCWQNKKRC